jgi:hypothetical protein
VVDGLLCRLHNADYQGQGYADDVVLLQKGEFVSTLCREIGLSVNADKTTMVLFTNNRKIGDFYNPRLFGTELRMTYQVKYLGVILVRSLIGSWKKDAQSLNCILAVSSFCRKDLGIITEGGGLALHFRGEVHSLVFFAGMMEESGAEKCSEMALSLAANDVFGKILVVCVEHQRLL